MIDVDDFVYFLCKSNCDNVAKVDYFDYTENTGSNVMVLWLCQNSELQLNFLVYSFFFLLIYLILNDSVM